MAVKPQTQVSSDEQKIAEIVAALKANRASSAKGGTITERLADLAAGSTVAVARIGAGFRAGVQNAGIAYQAELDRQDVRSAQMILAMARQ